MRNRIDDSGATLDPRRTDVLGGSEGGGEPDEWQSMWLVSRSLSIRGGTNEIERNIVGERALGLLPEPRVDKDRPFDQRD